MNIAAKNIAEGAHLSGFSARLVSAGILTREQSSDAEQTSRAQNQSLIRYLIDTRDVDSAALAEIASAEYGIPVFDVSAMNRDLLPDHQIDSDMMMKHHAVPLFQRGNRLFVAVSDPMNLTALNEFKFAAGMHTDANSDPVHRLVGIRFLFAFRVKRCDRL